MKLYELTDDIRQLAEVEDIPEEVIRDTLEGITGEFEDKAKNLIHVVLNMEPDLSAIDGEIARLQQRKKTIKSRQEWLKAYLRENMEAAGIKKISAPLFTITCVPGRDIVQINDADKLPEEYINVKTTIAPDKKKILDELKTGGVVPGAERVKSKSSIRIK